MTGTHIIYQVGSGLISSHTNHLRSALNIFSFCDGTANAQSKSEQMQSKCKRRMIALYFARFGF
jgi:hypothetical protein